MRRTGKRWGIVGGGFLGLTLALRLRQAGHDVTLFEAAPDLGGLASAWKIGDVVWDKHYHVILFSDLRLRHLLSELGLDDQCRWVTTRTGFFTDGKLYSLSNSWEFLRFPPINLIDKFRLGATIWRASKIQDWKKLEKIPVETWLRRWSGRRTFEKIWLPLLRSKLGESYKEASAAFIWAIIARMYAARRSGLKREMFGYVEGGYARILNRFSEILTEKGVILRPSSAVRAVRSHGDGINVELATGVSEAFDRVVVTSASPLAARLCPDLRPQERLQHEAVRYQGIVCASLLLRQSLSPFYVTNITEPWVPFTGVIEMSALVDKAAFNGQALVYLPKYVAPDDPLFSEPDDQIRERFLGALERMYPHFRRQDVVAFQVSRVRQVFAISTLDYSSQVPPFTTSIPGLYLVNSSQIVNGTLNVNETVQLAEAALAAIASPRHATAEAPE